MQLDRNRWPVMAELPMAAGRSLVVIDSTHLAASDPALIDREVFLVDASDTVIWQIDVPLEEHRKFHPEEPGGWPFVGLVQRDGGVYAQRFDGGLFALDLATGAGRYAMWIK